MNLKQYQIYSLSEPDTCKIRYIGFTSQSLNKRLKEHLKDNRKTHRRSWIESLKKRNLVPVIDNIEHCTSDNWKELEIYWISQFKYWGFDLVNMTCGGDGIVGYKYTTEQRKRNSERNKNKILTEETRRRISESTKGKIVSNETKEKIRLSHIGLVPDIETRLKMSKFQKGKKVSKETRSRISKSSKGKNKRYHQRQGKTILQFDLDGNFIKEWNKIKDVYELYKISSSSIINCLQQRSKSSGNFIWKYKEV